MIFRILWNKKSSAFTEPLCLQPRIWGLIVYSCLCKSQIYTYTISCILHIQSITNSSNILSYSSSSNRYTLYAFYIVILPERMFFIIVQQVRRYNDFAIARHIVKINGSIKNVISSDDDGLKIRTTVKTVC